MRWKIFFILLNTFFSILCAIITNNLLWTIIFVIGTSIIDILVEINIYIKLEKFMGKIFMSKWIYFFFAFLALLPTICGMIWKEINIFDDFPSKLFANLVPNILGTCIVCSIFNHISQFGYEQIVYSLMQSKKELLNTFVRITYFGCFINAVNYDINNNLKVTNFCNSFYLFFIIFFGTIAVVSFVLRIIDKQKFNYTIEKIYPSKTLIWGDLFLISCSIGPILFGIEKHEPILLLMNSITASVIVILLFVYLVRRTENESKASIKFFFETVFIFIVIAALNCILNFWKWDKTGDILQQFYSGLVILVFVCALLLYVNILQKRDNHFILKKKDLKSGMIVMLNNGFFYMVLLNTDMYISEYHDYGILLGISVDGNVKQNSCLRLLDYNDDLVTDDENFNVFEVYSTDRVTNIGKINNYNSIWRREKILVKN